MKMISPSKLAIQAASRQHGSQFKAAGLPAAEAGVCAMCGYAHDAGELVVNADFARSFTNWQDLAAPSSPVVCGCCESVGSRLWMDWWKKSIVTEDGVFSFSKNVEIAYWLLNPPEGRFAMFYGDQRIQHMVWRTPVNYNRDMFQVRMGENILTIRRKHLIAARDALFALSDITKDLARKAGEKVDGKFSNVFMRQSREMDHLFNGQIKNEILEHAKEDPETQRHVQTLQRCTPGEIWALTIVPYVTPDHAAVTPQVIK